MLSTLALLGVVGFVGAFDHSVASGLADSDMVSNGQMLKLALNCARWMPDLPKAAALLDQAAACSLRMQFKLLPVSSAQRSWTVR
jgi:hypothetical protein